MDKVLATLGEVHPTVTENYAIGTRVYLAELDVNTAYENESGTRTPQAPARKSCTSPVTYC